MFAFLRRWYWRLFESATPIEGWATTPAKRPDAFTALGDELCRRLNMPSGSRPLQRAKSDEFKFPAKKTKRVRKPTGGKKTKTRGR